MMDIPDWSLLENKKQLKNHVTIIIPVFNQAGLTERCLFSIFENSRDISFDLIIVDNHSNDKTSVMLHSLSHRYDNLAFIRNHRNLGFGMGCNIGAVESKGQYLVFLNNDTEVLTDWLPPLLEPLKQDPRIGMVGPRLLYKNNTLQCGGIVFNIQSKIPYPLYEHFPADHPVVNKSRYFQALTGACFAVRCQDFYKIKGFDPIYLNGMEDIDFCFRMRKILGKKILYNPNSTVYHLKGQTEGRGNFIKQNRKIFISKWKREIIHDDIYFYGEDGFIVKEYSPRTPGLDVEVAQFFPKLEPSEDRCV